MAEDLCPGASKPSDEQAMLTRLESARRHEALRPVAYGAAVVVIGALLLPAIELSDHVGGGRKVRGLILAGVFGVGLLVFRAVNEVLRRLTLRKP